MNHVTVCVRVKKALAVVVITPLVMKMSVAMYLVMRYFVKKRKYVVIRILIFSDCSTDDTVVISILDHLDYDYS